MKNADIAPSPPADAPLPTNVLAQAAQPTLLGPAGRAAEQAQSWIGPCQLLEKLSEGGFGTVLRSVQREPIHREVTLKVIKPGMDSAEIAARFAPERQALMDHHHIATVPDAGETADARPWFAMELVR